MNGAKRRARDLEFFGDGDAARLFEGAVTRLERLGGTAAGRVFAVARSLDWARIVAARPNACGGVRAGG